MGVSETKGGRAVCANTWGRQQDGMSVELKHNQGRGSTEVKEDRQEAGAEARARSGP